MSEDNKSSNYLSYTFGFIVYLNVFVIMGFLYFVELFNSDFGGIPIKAFLLTVILVVFGVFMKFIYGQLNLSNIFGLDTRTDIYNPVCSMMEGPLEISGSSFPMSIFMMGIISGYIGTPSFINNNVLLGLFLLILSGSIIVIKQNFKCHKFDMKNFLSTSVSIWTVGLIIGIVSYFGIQLLGDEYVYSTDLISKLNKCHIESKKFICFNDDREEVSFNSS